MSNTIFTEYWGTRITAKIADGTSTASSNATIKLHTGYPGSAGTSNLVGETPTTIHTYIGTPEGGSVGGGYCSRVFNSSQFSILNDSGADASPTYMSLWHSTNYVAAIPLNTSGVLYNDTSLTFTINSFNLGITLGTIILGEDFAKDILNWMVANTQLPSNSLGSYFQLHNGDPSFLGSNQASMGTRYNAGSRLTDLSNSTNSYVYLNATVSWQNTSGSEVLAKYLSIYESSSGGDMLVAVQAQRTTTGDRAYRIPNNGYFRLDSVGSGDWNIFIVA